MVAPVIAGVAESPGRRPAGGREAQHRQNPLMLVRAEHGHPRRNGEAVNTAERRAVRRALREAADRIHAMCPDGRLDDELIEGPAAPGPTEIRRAGRTPGRGLTRAEWYHRFCSLPAAGSPFARWDRSRVPSPTPSSTRSAAPWPSCRTSERPDAR